MSAAKKFASQADLQEKKVSFDKLSDRAYAYTAEGDPNTGVIVGDDAVMLIDTRATPSMAENVIRHVRSVTEKPIKYVLLSHYHAVRVMGASAYKADYVIASQGTYELIVERGIALVLCSITPVCEVVATVGERRLTCFKATGIVRNPLGLQCFHREERHHRMFISWHIAEGDPLAVRRPTDKRDRSPTPRHSGGH